MRGLRGAGRQIVSVAEHGKPTKRWNQCSQIMGLSVCPRGERGNKAKKKTGATKDE